MKKPPGQTHSGRMRSMRALASLRKEYRQNPLTFSIAIAAAIISASTTIAILLLTLIAPETLTGTH